MRTEYGEIKVPREILRKIEERIKGTEFESVEAYVNFVLEEVLKDEEEESSETFSEQDEEKVKDRLRALGYL